MQCLNPTQHKKYLDCIAALGRKDLNTAILDSLATSIQKDGSVDRLQNDNKHACGCAISHFNWNVTTTFMGFSEPEERGISGYLSSVHAACEPVIPWENSMNEISSVIPDGESLNTGERNGL